MPLSRKPLDSQAALATAVDYLLREFKALPKKASATTIINEGGETFTGPIEPTYLVAASDARAEIQAVADYVCDGVDDQDEIQAALNLLIGTGGKVQLTEGTFVVQTDIAEVDHYAIRMDQGQQLEGSGRGTIIEFWSQGSSFEEWCIVMDWNGCSVSNLAIDFANTTDDSVGILMNDYEQRIDSCWFYNMSNTGSGRDLRGISMYYHGMVSNCHFQDAGGVAGSEIGVESWGGHVINCFFDSPTKTVDPTGVYMQTDAAARHVIIGNTFDNYQPFNARASQEDIIFVGNVVDILTEGINLWLGAEKCIIASNSFTCGASVLAAIELYDTIEQLVIQGNRFFGSGIEFRSTAGIPDVTTCAITGNMFDNAYIIAGAAASDFKLVNTKISGNVFYNGYIDLGLNGAAVGANIDNLAIEDNQFWQNVGTPLRPAIGIMFANGGAVDYDGDTRIAGNQITNIYGAVSKPFGIELTAGIVGSTAGGAVVVESNVIEGTNGILITDLGHVTLRNNDMPRDDEATVTPFAQYHAHQAAVIGATFAYVDGNNLALADVGDKTGKDAVLYVEASAGGKVTNNAIVGHNSGTIDTAIEVSGPLFISENHYVGKGVDWGAAETVLTNELVVLGTGATVGDNAMTVDVSGATTPTFVRIEQVVWTHGPVIAVTTGLYEITFTEDVEVIEVEARVAVAPTGSTVIVDVHKDAVTLYTTQGLRPIIATATKSLTTTPDITAVAAGAVLTIDVDQKDSNDVAVNLSVTVRYRRA